MDPLQTDIEPGAVIVLADPVTALGYALAGVAVHTPETGHTRSALERAQKHYQVILITAELARLLPDHVIGTALAARDPITLLISDIRDREPLTDLAAGIRRRLGVEA